MSDEPNTNNAPPTEPFESPELEKFIFNPDTFTKEVVPRKIKVEDVARFLSERVDAQVELKHLLQVEKVAAFYDITEVAEKFKAFLTSSESGEDGVRRSIVFSRIVANLGNGSDLETAKQNYIRLISKVDTLVEFEDIIMLHDLLGLGAKSDVLRKRVADKIAELESKKDSSDEFRIQYLEFQGKIGQRLNRAEKAGPLKEQILGISDRKKRIKEEIKAYIGVDYGLLEFLANWSASRLRREMWAAEPSGQTTREVNPRLRAEVITAFKEVLSELDGFPDLADSEDKEAAKIQILRAIKFFDGQISEQDEIFLTQFKGEQADILANEGFLL